MGHDEERKLFQILDNGNCFYKHVKTAYVLKELFDSDYFLLSVLSSSLSYFYLQPINK